MNTPDPAPMDDAAVERVRKDAAHVVANKGYHSLARIKVANDTLALLARLARAEGERDRIEAAARLLVDAVEADQEWGSNCDPENLGCACDDEFMCSTCTARLVKVRAVALDAALRARGEGS